MYTTINVLTYIFYWYSYTFLGIRKYHYEYYTQVKVHGRVLGPTKKLIQNELYLIGFSEVYCAKNFSSYISVCIYVYLLMYFIRRCSIYYIYMLLKRG